MEEDMEIVKSAIRHAKSLVQRSRQETAEGNSAQGIAHLGNSDHLSIESLYFELHRLATSVGSTKTNAAAQIDLVLSTLSIFEKRLFVLSGEVVSLRKEREEMFRQMMIFRHDIDELVKSIISRIDLKIESAMFSANETAKVSDQ